MGDEFLGHLNPTPGEPVKPAQDPLGVGDAPDEAGLGEQDHAARCVGLRVAKEVALHLPCAEKLLEVLQQYAEHAPSVGTKISYSETLQVGSRSKYNLKLAYIDSDGDKHSFEGKSHSNN